jgi:hypothetical protein
MKKLLVVASIAAVVLSLALAVGIPALADEETPTPKDLGCWPGMRPGRGSGFFGGGSWSQFDAMAEALGLTPVELFTELHEGNSLEEIAEAQGVDLESVKEAMNTARAEAVRENIQQAVEDGYLTQEQADWMMEGIDKGFTPMRGGFDRGLRGSMPGGMRGGMRGGWFYRAPAETTSTELSSS